MMNLADPLFLIISPSPIMSSRTVKLRSSLSLSLSPQLGSFPLLIFSIFPRCLLAVSFLSFFHSSSILDELICHFSFNISLSHAVFCGSSVSLSLSLSLSLPLFISIHLFSFFSFFSRREGKQKVFKDSFISQIYSQLLSQLFFPPATSSGLIFVPLKEI